ncbi:50S ribosomal protein L24 [Candidatus Woesebacteria bacterium RIFCSPHIGHO2_01_FULL_37_10]|uniref:Large ribosomal subunit protein uL24 n=1 Tax=Candidatus Woesebacteria bacterium RIFCSPHIGHO2_01_FULL_37_10 TaxID=1802489 RepID=A0A1F7XTN9_9BACT|nr:MAG: 50S ribosomal protein L24 [Candidatus Woesebacteria bacterium RIFCSPHIGHO2_01_FULL_37_10]
MLKFKIGDTVKITSGKDKGREGKIEKIDPKNRSVLIPGINIYKKHVKGMPGQKGGIYDIPKPLPFSKFAIICPKCNKLTRIGFKMVGKEKLRFCKKCKKELNGKKEK